MTQTLLTDEEMLAALKDGDAAPSGTQETTPPAAETPAEDTLKAALAPLQEQLEKLQAQVGYANRKGTEVPPGVTEAIVSLKAEVAGIARSQEELRLRDMTDAERSDYYAAQLAEARKVAVEAVKPPVTETPQLDQRGIEYFDGELAPKLETIAATLGRSVDEARNYFKDSKVYPITDATGKTVGYDWTRFAIDFTSEMAKRSTDADKARETATANGDGRKPGSAIPKGLDPMDPKADLSTMLAAAAKSGAI